MAIEITSVREARRLPRLRSAAASLRGHAVCPATRSRLVRFFCASLIVVSLASLAVVVDLYFHY